MPLLRSLTSFLDADTKRIYMLLVWMYTCVLLVYVYLCASSLHVYMSRQVDAARPLARTRPCPLRTTSILLTKHTRPCPLRTTYHLEFLTRLGMCLVVVVGLSGFQRH